MTEEQNASVTGGFAGQEDAPVAAAGFETVQPEVTPPDLAPPAGAGDGEAVATVIDALPTPPVVHHIDTRSLRRDPEAIRHTFETGEYPYRNRLPNKTYMAQMAHLQVELLKAQNWVKETGQKIVVIFEGRDAAGKGGTIKRFMEHLNPRGARVVALEKPTEREKTQWYFQRYLEHLPAGGEIVFFDRSWYNRAGVERVMGFCTDAQYRQFLLDCPEFERLVTRDGLILLKYWLAVDQAEQEQRFAERASDPRKRWKLSPVDVKARADYAKYGKARDAMLEATHARHAPWFVVDFNDQRRGRLNLIAHLLKQLPEREPAPSKFDLPTLRGKPMREQVPKKYLIRDAW